MRDLFSVVAALLVAVLCAAVAVPYFVDWESRRAEVEGALGRAFGATVRTEGAITVRLLPTPRLDLERITVGGDIPFLTADKLNVALEAPPLISGRIEVTSARLVRPELRIAVDDQGAVRRPAQLEAPISGIESAGVARLEIEQGFLRLVDASGGRSQERVLGPVDASASAPALSGPWRIDGHYDRYTFHVATGAKDVDGRVRIKARASDTDVGGHADFDGYVQQGDRPSVSGRFGLSLTLQESAAGDANNTDNPRVTATAEISSDGWHLAAANVEIRSGEGTGAFLLNGEGSVDARPLRDGILPRVALDLSARRLDVQPLVGAWKGEESPLARFADRLLAGLPLALSLDAGSIAYGNEEFGAASVALQTDAGPAGAAVMMPRFDLSLPGGGRLAITDGRLLGGSGFSGSVDFTGGDVGRLANALKDAAVNAATIDELGLMLRLSQTLRDWPGLTVRGDVEASTESVAVRAFEASAGESAASGELVYHQGADGERARVNGRIALEGIDLGALPQIDPMAITRSGVDMDFEVDARRLRFGAAPAEDGRKLSARFATTAEGVAIERFELMDPDGARLTASGHLGEDGGRISVAMDAEDPSSLLALYRPLLPTGLGDTLEQSAPAMGPLKLEATIARPGAGRPLVAVLKGHAASTDIDARIVSDPGGRGDARAVVELRLASPDAGGLLRQLGLADVGGTASATTAGRLVIDAHGPSFAQLAGRATLSAGASRLRLDGQWRAGENGQNSYALSGPLELETTDAGALASLLRRPVPHNNAPITASLTGALRWQPGTFNVENLNGIIAGSPVTGGVSVSDDGLRGEIGLEQLALADVLALSLGPGARPQPGQLWSSQRLGDAAPTIEGRLALRVKRLTVSSALTLADATLQADVTADGMTLRVEDSKVEQGGQARGEIAFRRLGTQINLRGSAAVEGLALQSLTGDDIPGEMDGGLEFGASAESVAGLVANLAGGGELSIRGAAIPRFDPGALGRVIAEMLNDPTVDVDTGRVSTLLATQLDRGHWPVEELEAPLTLASGTLRFGPLVLSADEARAGISGSFELTNRMLDVRAHLTGSANPDGWSGAPAQAIVLWRGPFDAPLRQVEAGSIANGLAAIGLTRELDRIERLEAEARERIEKARREREERAREEAERLERERLERERLEREQQERQRQREEEERKRFEDDRAQLEALAREAENQTPLPHASSPSPVDSLPEPLRVQPERIPE